MEWSLREASDPSLKIGSQSYWAVSHCKWIRSNALQSICDKLECKDELCQFFPLHYTISFNCTSTRASKPWMAHYTLASISQRLLELHPGNFEGFANYIHKIQLSCFEKCGSMSLYLDYTRHWTKNLVCDTFSDHASFLLVWLFQSMNSNRACDVIVVQVASILNIPSAVLSRKTK